MQQITRQRRTALDFSIQMNKQLSSGVNYFLVAKQSEIISIILNDNSQTILDLTQIYVKWSAERGELQAIIRFQFYLVCLCIQ